ncbi:MAG TPA: DUF2231 domain-containing protein [Verrucomicrobiae bacterium]|nr:DUF2231 domain-containing protein [Verrucomicrobiae bacterium]
MKLFAAGALALALLAMPAVASAAEIQLPSLAVQVHAIFQAKCVECHGPDIARPKGKFGYVLDLARVAANPKMIVPGNPQKSELYQMVWHNEMPDPKGDSLPLTAEEKAIVKAWIETGALPLTGTDTGAALTPDPGAVRRLSLVQRIIRDVGQFHPPLTHFPIALLIVAMPAELLLLLTGKDSWRTVVRFCIWLGMLSALLTATLGWCDAAFSSYRGTSASVLIWHRWLGTTTALWALVVVVLLEAAHRRQRNDESRRLFRISLGLGIILVSVAGYLGASLIYGLDHFKW